MTPEEKFNRVVWYVLRQIKERLLYTKKKEPIEYVVKFTGYRDPKAPPEKDEVSILEKLQDGGAIQVIEKKEAPSRYDVQAIFFYLHILQPKFDEVYGEYGNKQKSEIQPKLSYQDLTTADRKKLCVLEKLKEARDLVSTKYSETTATKVSWQKLIWWEEECGIDKYQLENILRGFQAEGLIETFKLYNPAR